MSLITLQHKDGLEQEFVESFFDVEILPDGRFGYNYEGDAVFLVLDDLYSPYKNYEVRYHPLLNCPPCVFVAFTAENETSGPARTPMAAYGWTEYLMKLNGDKWEAATAPNLAMFNTREQDDDGNDLSWEQRDNMESLFFGGGALVRARPAPRYPYVWAEIITHDYYAGPPAGMPTFWENPIAVQRFTAICRSGGLILHMNDFFYPVTCKDKIFMKWSALERFTNRLVGRYENEPREGARMAIGYQP